MRRILVKHVAVNMVIFIQLTTTFFKIIILRFIFCNKTAKSQFLQMKCLGNGLKALTKIMKGKDESAVRCNYCFSGYNSATDQCNHLFILNVLEGILFRSRISIHTVSKRNGLA